MLEIRKRYKKLRQTLTGYETEWFSAKTVKERKKIRGDFNKAWEALINIKNQPNKRFVHIIWEILKKPHYAHVAIGDLLKSKDIENQLIDRVKGIRSFYSDLEDIPLTKESQKVLNQTFPINQDNNLWKFYKRVSNAHFNQLKIDMIK